MWLDTRSCPGDSSLEQWRALTAGAAYCTFILLNAHVQAVPGLNDSPLRCLWYARGSRHHKSKSPARPTPPSRHHKHRSRSRSASPSPSTSSSDSDDEKKQRSPSPSPEPTASEQAAAAERERVAQEELARSVQAADTMPLTCMYTVFASCHGTQVAASKCNATE